MLLFITTSGQSRPVDDLIDRRLGFDTPHCAATTYDRLFRWNRTVNAVHVFTDLERLSDWELLVAADLYRALRAAGIVCLNDPARVMTRYQLLTNLKAKGINPFGVHRADGLPQPARFPVFVRSESDHSGALSGLLADQAELDRCLADLRRDGHPLRGLIVTEFAAEPIAPGVWRKFGVFRIGPNISLHHAIVADGWMIKEQKKEVITDAMYQEEQDAMRANSPSENVRAAFDIGGIEWGRADFAPYQGRDVIYEINTNPLVQIEPQISPIRTETKKITGGRLAELLWKIDAGNGQRISFQPLARTSRKSLRRFVFWQPLKRP